MFLDANDSVLRRPIYNVALCVMRAKTHCCPDALYDSWTQAETSKLSWIQKCTALLPWPGDAYATNVNGYSSKSSTHTWAVILEHRQTISCGSVICRLCLLGARDLGSFLILRRSEQNTTVSVTDTFICDVDQASLEKHTQDELRHQR
ncbi:hypothetical protein CRM22_010977 [Opisthorchis felineus]|uniref:Uncharacterized protein n=1 Tax=Opisthorchis felineus TaxID=147828 RepID=A0A4S2KHJ6_OPIFE|nr:hypothetical protein CRM22_010977 [Opisthorchis felineus]